MAMNASGGVAMDRDVKRLIVAVGTGVFMSLVVWLFLSEASPTYEYLKYQEAGHAVLLLNLPALFVSRIISGTPPSETLVYLACFIQWFAIGLAVSSAIWRTRNDVHPERVPVKK